MCSHALEILRNRLHALHPCHPRLTPGLRVPDESHPQPRAELTGRRRKDPEQERKEREAERREFKSIFKSVMELGESC
jgi:hypothetical protein